VCAVGTFTIRVKALSGFYARTNLFPAALLSVKLRDAASCVASRRFLHLSNPVEPQNDFSHPFVCAVHLSAGGS